MWRKFHVLGSFQVFVVSSISAAIFASAFALTEIGRPDNGILHDFPWPHAYNPLIGFSSVFLAAVPAFLVYYHVGRVAVLVGPVIGYFIFVLVSIVALYAFWLCPHWLAPGVFSSVCFLFYLFVALAHRKASRAPSIAEAQRLLRLV